jgi:hypothetical protein
LAVFIIGLGAVGLQKIKRKVNRRERKERKGKEGKESKEEKIKYDQFRRVCQL